MVWRALKHHAHYIWDNDVCLFLAFVFTSYKADYIQSICFFISNLSGACHAPSMDVELVLGLDLPRNVQRLNVENLGCLTGFRCLSAASDLARVIIFSSRHLYPQFFFVYMSVCLSVCL
jgi:predicted naringenin-chalcone synthase